MKLLMLHGTILSFKVDSVVIIMLFEIKQTSRRKNWKVEQKGRETREQLKSGNQARLSIPTDILLGI